MKQIKFNTESKYTCENNSKYFDTITLKHLLTSIDEHLYKFSNEFFDKDYIKKFTTEDYKQTTSDLDFSKKLENYLKKEKNE